MAWHGGQGAIACVGATQACGHMPCTCTCHRVSRCNTERPNIALVLPSQPVIKQPLLGCLCPPTPLSLQSLSPVPPAPFRFPTCLCGISSTLHLSLTRRQHCSWPCSINLASSPGSPPAASFPQRPLRALPRPSLDHIVCGCWSKDRAEALPRLQPPSSRCPPFHQ